jgi:hypothetical protein
VSDDGLKRVHEVLDALGPRLGIGRSQETGLVWSRWPDIVGPVIVNHAEPTSLREGVLRVRADSPTWANELVYVAPEIQRRANDLTGSNTVTAVKIWTKPGPLRRLAGRASQAPGPPSGEGESIGRAGAYSDRDARTAPSMGSEPVLPSDSPSDSEASSSRPREADPMTAFERAKEAWERRRRHPQTDL